MGSGASHKKEIAEFLGEWALKVCDKDGSGDISMKELRHIVAEAACGICRREAGQKCSVGTLSRAAAPKAKKSFSTRLKHVSKHHYSASPGHSFCHCKIQTDRLAPYDSKGVCRFRVAFRCPRGPEPSEYVSKSQIKSVEGQGLEVQRHGERSRLQLPFSSKL